MFFLKRTYAASTMLVFFFFETAHFSIKIGGGEFIFQTGDIGRAGGQIALFAALRAMWWNRTHSSMKRD